jgi:phenylalanyl-tRNA synthetase alpha chain
MDDASKADLERALLQAVSAGGVDDTGAFAAARGLKENDEGVTGVVKSLVAADMVAADNIKHSRVVLTATGRDFAAAGSAEARAHAATAPDGTSTMDDLRAALGADVAKLGFPAAMAAKWLRVDKSGGGTPRVVRVVDAVTDSVGALCADLAAGRALDAAALDALKKRKLIATESWTTYKLSKGPAFALERAVLATDVTAAMVASGAWRGASFKPLNYDAVGALPSGGALHPLLKVRAAYRRIFTQMGFAEMETNAWVESSFWNFDALFQPQQHPARDAHDTFFVADPATTPLTGEPAAYVDRVRAVHERGGHGSTGYQAPWSPAEAEKNLLRTHTTAVSSRMLHALATTGFQPARLFSIDRVFRNEAVDRTHLAEFHQVEGLVCGPGLSLGHLTGTLAEFFRRLGLTKLRFKPAYNPYTEPSMEIFAWSDELARWMEVGNSGMFRPEMLAPMGLPEGVRVIAWGLSLERPTMILYGIDNIRDLFGHRVSLSTVRHNPICRLGF